MCFHLFIFVFVLHASLEGSTEEIVFLIIRITDKPIFLIVTITKSAGILLQPN
jgi:hypothetical protein